MEAAIADSVDPRDQLKPTQVEAGNWQAAALRATGVIESLKKSIFTLETEPVRVPALGADRLALSEKIISILQVVVQARDREISRLTD